MDSFMEAAFNIAKTADFMRVRPNPLVGAVVVSGDGVILGQGCHEQFGQAHAEVHAINNALRQKSDLSRCSLYVTLEPCSHQGKTPPCTELIKKHGIKRVIVGSRDPNPLVSGVDVLRNAGIDVEVHNHPELIELNKEFFVNQRYQRPYVVLKMAMTIDGKIADRNGNSKWLSNELSRKYVHEKLRPSADAILTTYNTIIKDDARLNIRKQDGSIYDKNVLVIDRDLKLLNRENSGLSIFQTHPNSIIYLFGAQKELKKVPDNVRVIFTDFDVDGNINLEVLMKLQFDLQHYRMLVEAGGKLATQLLMHNYIDEMHLFIAPKLMMDQHAIKFINANTILDISSTKEFELTEVNHIQSDAYLIYVRKFL